jgi:hypothetical protein
MELSPLEKLPVVQLLKNFPTFLDAEGSLSCSLVPILSQIDSVHNTATYFSRTHFNIIHQPMSTLPSDHFHSGSPTKFLYAFFLSPIRATCLFHLIIFDLIILITLGENLIK